MHASDAEWPPATADTAALEALLVRWDGDAPADDPFVELKADVAAYGHLDPLTTLRELSRASGIPIGALVRYVLARWATGGSEALLELGVSGVDHLARAVEAAEREGTDAARLVAYATVREVVGWLREGLEPPGSADEAQTEPPSDGTGAVR